MDQLQAIHGLSRDMLLERCQKAEKALAESEERLSEVQRIAGIGRWEFDIVSNQLVWSDTIFNLFEIDPHRFGASYDAFLQAIHPDDRQMVNRAYTESLKNKTPYDIVHRLGMPDGRIKWVREICRTDYDENDQPTRSVGIVQDVTALKEAELALHKSNRALRMLSDCNQALVRATEETDLLKDVCRAIVEIGGYRMAWVGFAEEDAAKSIRPAAQAGFEEGYLDTLRLTWEDSERGRGPTGTAIRTGKPCVVREIPSDPRFVPWREEACKRGYTSSLAMPLIVAGQTLGALNIYSGDSDAFSAEELQLLAELAEDLAFGILALRARAEREKTEEALRELEERFEVFMDHLPAAVFMKDTQGRVLYTNRFVRELFGWGETTGKSTFDLLPTEVARKMAEDDQLVFERGPVTISERITDTMGHGYIFETRKFLVHQKGASPILGGISIDTTERHRLEEQLRNSEERLRLALEAANDGLWDWHVPTGHAYFSPRYYTMLDYDPGEFEGGYAAWRSLVHPDDIDATETSIRRTTGDREVGYAVEFRMRTKGGQWKWILSRGKAFESTPEGKVIRLVGTHTDITERKRAEEELERYRDHLEELVRDRTRELEETREELVQRERLAVLGQLTATVSHELRNPLGVIRSSVFYLQRKNRDADEKTFKHLRRIEDQVKACDAVVDDLLEYTRGRRADKTPGNLNAWIIKLLGDMKQPGGFPIVNNLASHLPKVSFDQERLRRVMVNLVENARHAATARLRTQADDTSSYQPSVTVGTRQGDQEVIIEVEDNEIGMDEETAGRAFEPLFTTRARGTGLGLAIVRKIVEEHGGRVSLMSRPNEGTTVTVRLPLH